MRDSVLDDIDSDVALVKRGDRRWPLRIAVSSALVLALGGAAFGLSYKWKYDDSVTTRTGDLRVLDARIAALRGEQEQRRSELNDVHRAIAEARTALAVAQRESRIARCQATNARLDAEITVRQVECFQEQATVARCHAANSKSEADSTLFGALLGAGLAVATGGGSMLVLGGTALGRAAAEHAECPLAACTIDPKALEPEVLRAHGLRAREVCVEVAR